MLVRILLSGIGHIPLSIRLYYYRASKLEWKEHIFPSCVNAMSDIYCVLDQFLDSYGITVAQFAKDTGLAYNTVKRLVENKFTSIDLRTVDSICEHFDCTPGDFLRRKNTKAQSLKDRTDFLREITELLMKGVERDKQEWMDKTKKTFSDLINQLLEEALTKHMEDTRSYSDKVVRRAKAHMEQSAEFLIAQFDLPPSSPDTEQPH